MIDDIKLLRPGWLDGEGDVASPADLDRLIRWFAIHLTADAPLPHLYPTPEGGVQAEWTFGAYEITLNIDLPSGDAIWHALDLATNTDEEITLNVWHPDTGRFITEALRRAGESVQ